MLLLMGPLKSIFRQFPARPAIAVVLQKSGKKQAKKKYISCHYPTFITPPVSHTILHVFSYMQLPADITYLIMKVS